MAGADIHRPCFLYFQGPTEHLRISREIKTIQWLEGETRDEAFLTSSHGVSSKVLDCPSRQGRLFRGKSSRLPIYTYRNINIERGFLAQKSTMQEFSQKLWPASLKGAKRQSQPLGLADDRAQRCPSDLQQVVLAAGGARGPEGDNRVWSVSHAKCQHRA